MTCARSFVLDHSALTSDDVKRAGQIPHKPEVSVAAFTVGLRAALEFVNWCVLPTLNTLVNPSPKELALALLFGRIRLLAGTLSLLTDFRHYQTVVGASRTAVELYVDMQLIARDIVPNGNEKFFAFSRLQKLKVARRMIEFHDRNPGLRKRPLDDFRNFVTAHGATIDAERVRLWGEKQKPDHWTNMSFDRRSKALGPNVEQLVSDGYDYRNWLIHSGAAGAHGMSDQAVQALAASGVSDVHEALVGAVALLAAQLHLSRIVDDIDKRIAELALIPGFVIADLALQSLGESQRVFITHPERDK